jgi:hypothetical protein
VARGGESKEIEEVEEVDELKEKPPRACASVLGGTPLFLGEEIDNTGVRF